MFDDVCNAFRNVIHDAIEADFCFRRQHSGGCYGIGRHDHSVHRRRAGNPDRRPIVQHCYRAGVGRERND